MREDAGQVHFSLIDEKEYCSRLTVTVDALAGKGA
mgnify:CR=1 FL=1